MGLNRRIMLGVAACAALGFGMGGQAWAQAYPNQAVRIVVPFSAGSATDILARIVGDKLSQKWGQSVLIENKPGIPGTASVAKSAPDGYTLMLTSNGHTIAGVVNKNIGFDTVKDFVGVAPVASVPVLLIVSPDLQAKNLQELLDLARANPGKLNFASPGFGSSTFIAAALFKAAAKIDIFHVPYKGAPEAVTSVVRGDTQMYFTPINVGVELVSAGKVRALAVATGTRNPTMPNIPTLAEAGMAGFKYDSWFGLMAPANTPADIVNKINADVNDILKLEDINAKFAAQGLVAMPMSPQAFDKINADDTAKLADIFKDGVK
jgi:tripartite-type tricarboxylate transporter receptor subunit TctC